MLKMWLTTFSPRSAFFIVQNIHRVTGLMLLNTGRLQRARFTTGDLYLVFLILYIIIFLSCPGFMYIRVGAYVINTINSPHVCVIWFLSYHYKSEFAMVLYWIWVKIQFIFVYFKVYINICWCVCINLWHSVL